MTNGLPGLAGPEHIGITVPDLEAAKDFFIDVIGCKLVFDGGASGRNPNFMQTSLGVHPDSEFKFCFLRCGFGANLEVFEYSSSEQKLKPQKNSDIGGHHVAFYVDDIEAAINTSKQVMNSDSSSDIQAARDELERATLPLAALLMDDVAKAALSGKRVDEV